MYSNKKQIDDQLIADLSLLSVGALKGEFKPIDVIYMVELFKDLLQTGQDDKDILEFARYVDLRVKELLEYGSIVEVNTGFQRTFSLNKDGLMELVDSVFRPDRYQSVGEILFLEHIVKSYGDFFMEQFCKSYELSDIEVSEIHTALFSDDRLHDQMRHVDALMSDLERRIKSADQMIALIQNSAEKDEDYDNLPAKFKARLSYRQSVEKLMSSFPEDLKKLELSTSTSSERNDYYTKKLKVFGRHKDVIKGLLGS